MIVIGNMDEVSKLGKLITMEGGKGDMNRNVQRFSSQTEKNALKVIDSVVGSPDDAFGKVSGDIGMLSKAAGIRGGQLGTPVDTVRYWGGFADNKGEALNAKDTYIVTVPAGLVEKDGYYSVTIYGSDNKLLIPNDKKIYDQTSYSSKANSDGTYTITLSPSGEGVNGIPTGKPFYVILRAYVPSPNAVMELKIEKK